jgi:hypothetical protein
MAGLISKGGGLRKLHAHEAVYAQAKELCLSAYEALMGENEIFAAWRASHPGFSRRHLELAFLQAFTFRFVPAARAMMAARLQAPLDAATKDALYEALLLDATLLRGRGRPLAPPQTKV